jgi:hypothetical protein
MRPSPTAHEIILAISSQTDPVKLETLKSAEACNPRLNRCIYWLHEAKRQDLDLKWVISEAVRTHKSTERERRLVKRALLRNYKRFRQFGCDTEGNLKLLRHGGAATITRGRHAGEKLEVDHIVPKELVPALAKAFPNLSYQARSVNRSKSDRLSTHQVTAMEIFARNGLVPASSVLHLRALVDAKLTGRTARAALPGSVVHLQSLPSSTYAGGQAINPELLLVRIGELIDRIRDWEPRGDAVIATAELVQRQTGEHLSRTNALLSQIRSRGQDDIELAQRLQNELSNWLTSCQTSLSNARQAVNSAQNTRQLASQTFQHWQQERNAARQWLQRARHRENRAQAEVDRAEAALSRAQNALSTAEDALERARQRTKVVGRDSDGKPIREPIDTTPYENRVAEAEEKVSRCQRRLDEAQDELRVATTEREAAEERVAACERAIQIAQQAQQIAGQGLQRAHVGVDAVNRATEEHKHAESIAAKVKLEIGSSVEGTQKMERHVTAGATAEREAATNLQSAQNNHAEARRRSSMATMEIAWRADELRAFDRPMNTLRL